MERDKGLSILASSGWLARTPDAFKSRLLSASQWRAVDQGATVTLGGEENNDIIGLAHGTVAVTSTLGMAGTPMMHMAHAVFWMGYGPLLLDRARDVTVEARTDLWIAVIPMTKVLPLLGETRLWLHCFMRLLAEYGDTAALIASDLLIRRSDHRLAATILRFAGLRDVGRCSSDEIRIPATQSELAEAANLSRNSAGLMLRRFEAKGYIEIDYKGIVVRNSSGLQSFLGLHPQ